MGLAHSTVEDPYIIYAIAELQRAREDAFNEAK